MTLKRYIQQKCPFPWTQTHFCNQCSQPQGNSFIRNTYHFFVFWTWDEGTIYVLAQIICFNEIQELLGHQEGKYLLSYCWTIIEGLGLLRRGLRWDSGHFICSLSLHSFSCSFVKQKQSVAWLTKLNKTIYHQQIKRMHYLSQSRNWWNNLYSRSPALNPLEECYVHVKQKFAVLIVTPFQYYIEKDHSALESVYYFKLSWLWITSFFTLSSSRKKKILLSKDFKYIHNSNLKRLYCTPSFLKGKKKKHFSASVLLAILPPFFSSNEGLCL